MKMSEQKCLTLFDVTGIQEFVFGPNKAKENIGGSIYVQQIFEQGLKECIGENNSTLDWENHQELQIVADDSIRAEIVYIGGGNAMVVFNSKTTAVEITKKLSKKLLDDTQATLGVVVAHLETDLDNFQHDRKELFDLLRKKKKQFVNSIPLRGISITEECADGLPTPNSKKTDKNFVSKTTAHKIKLAEKDSQFDDLLPEGYLFPKEFDDLGQQEGESHIAVVHIDGNSMGRFIDKQLENITDYSVAIPNIRDISKKIRNLYRRVFKEMVKNTTEALNENVQKRIKLKYDKKSGLPFLPLRPIILNGDDVTFVCDGRIGIQLANHFLKLLLEKELELDSGNEALSACAGIAIVKSHFPFYRAYELAEELCGSAKKKAKTLNKENPGSWMDYHIVYSGFQLDLDAMRKEQYNVPGMDAVSRNVEYPQYNLLLRPFCVAGKADKYYQWKKMFYLYRDLAVDYKEKKPKTFPRSRLKNLRNGFITSKEEVRQIVIENASRNYNLPAFEIGRGLENLPNSEGEIFTEKQTPYFEPLELLDFYIPELKLEQEDR